MRVLGTVGHWSPQDWPTTLRVTYTGYPQPSPVRWIAAFLALCLLGLGLVAVFGKAPGRKLIALKNDANSPRGADASLDPHIGELVPTASADNIGEKPT
jgi:hypothetical protein